MRWVCLAILAGLLVVRGGRDIDELQEFERMMAEPKDRSGWVDPLDMGMYDNKQDTCTEVVDRLSKCEKELGMVKTKIEEQLRNVNHSRSTTVKSHVHQTTSVPVTANPTSEVFLKRHVNHLVSSLHLSTNTPAHLKLEIFLTPFEVQTLHNFISAKSTVHAVDVDHILSSFIKSYDTYEAYPWIETLKMHMSSMKDPLLVIFLSLALLYVTVTGLRRLPAFHVFCIILLMSVSWHWVHMYKATWAKKHSKLMQSTEVPAECRPHEMTWYQTIQASATSMVSSVDRCEEYHKAILVDPIYEVNPATALVDLITKIILHPLSSVGKEVGSMFTGLLGEVPLLWKVPVLILFVILLMFVMILLAGYEIRLPLFLGKIGPANNASKEKIALQHQISELKNMITTLKSDKLAVDGRGEKQLEFESNQIARVEDLVPLGYDCHQKTHTADDNQFMLEHPGTPSRRSNLQKNRMPTPLKTRGMSQPELFQNKMNTDLYNTETADNHVLDLTKKRSDSFPNKSPVKSLHVKDFDSPKSTKFEWISTDEVAGDGECGPSLLMDQDAESQEPCIDKLAQPSEDFLNKVEDLFKSPQE